MSANTIDIKIGVLGSQKKELYQTLDCLFEFHQEKLDKICHELCSALSKNTPPFVVVEMPPQLRNSQIFTLKDYDCGFHSNGGKSYFFGNPKQKQTVKFVKNVEKEFQKITKLNNSCSLKLSLYDPVNRQKGIGILNQSKIRGSLTTDPDLVSTLIDIVRRISNDFLNSPPMALFQLLQQFAWKAEQSFFKYRLDNIEEFPVELQKGIAEWFSFKEWINRQRLTEMIETKGEIVVHITLPKLFSLRIKSETSTFGMFLSSF